MRAVRALAALALLPFVSCHDSTAPGITGAQVPADAVFVTSDIAHFWHAYDIGKSVAAFQSQYIDQASAGLKDFISIRSVTALSLQQMVTAFPQYFAAIRLNMLSLTGASSPVIDKIRQNYGKVEAIYPKAIYPPVTFLVGRFSTGGTTSGNGMLIGTEFYAIDANTPLTELGSFQANNVHPLDSLPLIVAHEHAHIMQQAGGQHFGGGTLLEQSLMEGSADFIGELVAGSHINKAIYVYGYANEASLWTEFKLAMNGTNVSQWLYNQGSATGARPGDLGYFIGYRIAQAYYLKQTDKNAAFRDIIEAHDAAAFLAASGYDGAGPPPPP